MRWSVVRLIAAREIRDQLRDRRTLFLILGLPVLMYPLFVGVGSLCITALKEERLVIGVAGAQHLPQPQPDLTPVVGGAGGTAHQMRVYPPLLGEDGQFSARYAADSPDSVPFVVKTLDATDDDSLRALLAARQVDAVVVVDVDTAAKLERGERPAMRVLGRDGEENSKLAVQRVTAALHRWSDDVKA